MARGDSDQPTQNTGSVRGDMNGTSEEACGMVQFDTTKAQRASQTMARMRGMGEKEARSWVRYWSTKGIL